MNYLIFEMDYLDIPIQDLPDNGLVIALDPQKRLGEKTWSVVHVVNGHPSPKALSWDKSVAVNIAKNFTINFQGVTMFDQQKLFDKNRKLEEELRIKDEVIAALKESNSFYAARENWTERELPIGLLVCSIDSSDNEASLAYGDPQVHTDVYDVHGGKLARKTQSKVQKLEKELEKLRGGV